MDDDSPSVPDFSDYFFDDAPDNPQSIPQEDEESRKEHDWIMSICGTIPKLYKWQEEMIDNRAGLCKLKRYNAVISATPGAGKTWVILANILQWLMETARAFDIKPPTHFDKQKQKKILLPRKPRNLVIVTAPFVALCEQLYGEISEVVDKANKRWNLEASVELCVGEGQSHKHRSHSIIVCTYEHARVFMLKAHKKQMDKNEANLGIPVMLKSRLNMLFIDEIHMITDPARGHVIDELLFLSQLIDKNFITQCLSGTLSRYDREIFINMGYKFIQADTGDKQFYPVINIITHPKLLADQLTIDCVSMIRSNIRALISSRRTSPRWKYDPTTHNSLLSLAGFGIYVFSFMKNSRMAEGGNDDEIPENPIDTVNRARAIYTHLTSPRGELTIEKYKNSSILSLWKKFLESVRAHHQIDIDEYRKRYSERVYIKNIGPKDVPLNPELFFDMLEVGIAVHNADLEADLQKLVIRLATIGAVKIISCTITLAVGVNIKNFNRVFIMQSVRFDPIMKCKIPAYPNKLLMQIAGRSARNMMGYVYILNQDRKFSPEKYVSDTVPSKNKEDMIGTLASFIYTESVSADMVASALKRTYCALFDTNESVKSFYDSNEEKGDIVERVLNNPSGNYMSMLNIIDESGIFEKIKKEGDALRLTSLGRIIAIGKGSPLAAEQIMRLFITIARDIEESKFEKKPTPPIPVSSIAPIYILSMMLATGAVLPEANANMSVHPKQNMIMGSYLFGEASRIMTAITDMVISPSQFSSCLEGLRGIAQRRERNMKKNAQLSDKQRTLEDVLHKVARAPTTKDMTREEQMITSANILVESSVTSLMNKTLPSGTDLRAAPVNMFKLAECNRAVRTFAGMLKQGYSFEEIPADPSKGVKASNSKINFDTNTIAKLLEQGIISTNKGINGITENAIKPNARTIKTLIAREGLEDAIKEYAVNGVNYSAVVKRYMSFVHYIVDCCYSLMGLSEYANTYFVGGASRMIYQLVKFTSNFRSLIMSASDISKINFTRSVTIGGNHQECPVFNDKEKEQIKRGFVYFREIVERFYSCIFKNINLSEKKEFASAITFFPRTWYMNHHPNEADNPPSEKYMFVNFIIADHCETKEFVDTISIKRPTPNPLDVYMLYLGYYPGNACLFITNNIKELGNTELTPAPIVTSQSIFSFSPFVSAKKKTQRIASKATKKVLFEEKVSFMETSDDTYRLSRKRPDYLILREKKYKENTELKSELLENEAVEEIISDNAISYHLEEIKAVVRLSQDEDLQLNTSAYSPDTQRALSDNMDMIREVFSRASNDTYYDLTEDERNIREESIDTEFDTISSEVEEIRPVIEKKQALIINTFRTNKVLSRNSDDNEEVINFYYTTANLVEAVFETRKLFVHNASNQYDDDADVLVFE